MPEEAPVPVPDVVPDVAPESAPQSAPESVDQLPSWAQKIITDARKEAGDFRVSAKTAGEKAQQELTDKLAVALGLKPDPTLDPTALTQQVSAAQAKANQAAIQLAVYKAASANQGNPDALLDSNTFLANVSALDPSSSDFNTQVSAAVKAAVAANPTLKAARAASASGIELGGSEENGQITEAQLRDMSPDEIVKAQSEGRLRNLLS